MSERTKPPGDWAQWIAARLGLKSVQAGTVRLVVIALLVGVLAMTVMEELGGLTETQQPAGSREVSLPVGSPQDELTRMEQEIAGRLARTLAGIQGAGEVEVSVTLAAGPTVTPVTDTRVDRNHVTETAPDNSHRETDQTNTTTTNVMSKNGSADSLVVARKDRAEIAGVVVVAAGARDSRVRERLTSATVTALKISPHRVIVMPRKGG